jgi:hypothetical protein
VFPGDAPPTEKSAIVADHVVDDVNRLQATLKRLSIVTGAGYPEIFLQPEKFTDLMVNSVPPKMRP